MKNKQLIFGVLAVASLSLTACSTDDIEVPQEEITPNPEEVLPDSPVRALASFDFETELGKSVGTSTESRTPADVDDRYRPMAKYRMNHVYMMSLTPKTQPTPSDGPTKIVVDYKDGEKLPIQRHEFQANGQYKLYYQLIGITSNGNKGASDSGKIKIGSSSDMKDALTFDLSVFNLEDLQNKNTSRIPLNKFAFNKGVSGNLKGSVLRYSSYNTLDLPKGSIEDGKVTLSGRYASLPEMPSGFEFLKGKDPTYTQTQHLVSECKDEYFAGNEFLIAAAGEKIYLLEVIPKSSAAGGYFLRRTYPSSDQPTEGTPNYLALNRLTTIINASFMLMDDNKGKSDYFVIDNKAKTIQNFKNQYGVDLSDLKCPYATLDGINARFYIGDIEHSDKCADRSRLVLWAEGHEVVGVDGKKHKKFGTSSMDVLYDHGNGIVAQGYGILGNTHCVAFEGTSGDTEGEKINFWTTVEGGVKVKITVTIPTEAGVPFDKNVAHHIIVFVPAQKYADSVKKYRATKASRANSADDYIELNLSSDCVKIQ